MLSVIVYVSAKLQAHRDGLRVLKKGTSHTCIYKKKKKFFCKNAITLDSIVLSVKIWSFIIMSFMDS